MVGGVFVVHFGVQRIVGGKLLNLGGVTFM